MRIIVCVKQIRHTYARTGSDYEAHYIRPVDAIRRINPFDEAATELALRLRDTQKDTTVTLLTLGELTAEAELRRCLAAGADELFRLPLNPCSAEGCEAHPDLVQPDPAVKADLIARAAARLGADLVLCGKESLDRASGQVGARVAQQLDRPFVSAITDLSFDPKARTFRVRRSAGRGAREEIQCAAPAVFSVDLGTDLRLPSFKAQIRADTCTIVTPEVGEARASSARVTCKAVFQPRPRPRMIPAPDSTLGAYERVLRLLTGSRTEKKGELLTGSPEAQAEGLIAFLRQNEFIGHD